MELYCAYSGQDWKCFKSEFGKRLEKEIEKMKPANNRPSHMIYSKGASLVYDFGRDNIWIEHHYIDVNNDLWGGTEFTRKRFQRLLPKIKSSAIVYDLDSDLHPSTNSQIISSVVK